MIFLDPKERVIDLQLTSYGKYMLSVGKFKPAMYAFFDDDIIYDNRFAQSGSATKTKELQNEIEPRIQENTPRLATQTLHRGSEIGVFSTNPNLINDLMPGVLADKKNKIAETPEKQYLLYNPLGTSAYNSDKMPAWSISFLKAPLSASYTAITGSRNDMPTTFIPQLHCDITNVVDKYPASLELKNAIYGETGLQPEEASDSEIYDDQIVFLDGSSIEYTKDFVMLQIEEANAEFLKDNFEIEVYEILEMSGSENDYSEVLERLHFDRTDAEDKSGSPDFIEYYFDIQIDNEIDGTEFCSLSKQNNKIQNIYVDDTFICPDKTKTPTVSLNIYGTGENEDTEGVC